jgi:hypothetical protein
MTSRGAGARSRTKGGRGAWRARGASASLRDAAIMASVAAVVSSCAERERPGMIADLQIEAAEGTVSGSFRAPAGPSGSAPGSSGDVAGAGAEGQVDGGVADSTDAGAASATTQGSVTLEQSYQGTCEGSTVQWGFFTYRTQTPGDSSIGFRVRTAPTEVALAHETYRDLITASVALGTVRCNFTGPARCPLDLYELLGGAPLAHHPFAQLEVLFNPDSEDGRMPSVEEWQLTFSCTFNQ